MDLDNAEAIVALTPCTRCALPGVLEKGSVLVVTSLDRMNRESDPVELRIK